jgi:hypothetical protein
MSNTMSKFRPSTLKTAILGALVLFSGCGERIVIRKEVLEIPVNSWGVPFKFQTRSEVPAAIANTGNAVVHINDYLAGGVGSGFLVTNDGIMITAAHVIPRNRCLVGSCKGIVVVRDSRPGGANEVFNGVSPIFIDERTDVAAFRLTRANGDLQTPTPYLTLSKRPIAFEGTHWVVGHPMGGTQKFSEYVPVDIEAFRISGRGALIFGNSGGPIVEPETGHVIGIAHAIDSDFSEVRVDGRVPTVSYIKSLAYFPIIMEASRRDLDSCGVLSPNAELNLKVWLSALEKCEKKPFSRRITPAFTNLLPKAFDPNGVLSAEHVSTYRYHFLLDPSPEARLASDVKKDTMKMLDIVLQYQVAASDVGFWLLESESFKAIKKSYESMTMEMKLGGMFGAFQVHDAGGSMSISPPSAQSIAIPVPKIPTKEDCLKNMKSTGVVLKDVRAELLGCQNLPESLTKAHRASFLQLIQKEAKSGSSEALLSYLTVFETYLLNGGEPATQEEFDQISTSIKTQLARETKLRTVMKLDAAHYHLQYPEIFADAEMLKKSMQGPPVAAVSKIKKVL